MGKHKFPKYPYVGSLVPNISGDDTDEANFPDIWDQICPLWAGPKKSRFSDDFFGSKDLFKDPKWPQFV